jgi:hypothetical protein
VAITDTVYNEAFTATNPDSEQFDVVMSETTKPVTALLVMMVAVIAVTPAVPTTLLDASVVIVICGGVASRAPVALRVCTFMIICDSHEKEMIRKKNIMALIYCMTW